MTQIASARSVRGRFDNVILTSPEADYHLSRSGDQFRVDIFEVSPGAKSVTARTDSAAASQKTFTMRGNVALLTGSHQQQVYWVSTRLGNLQVAMPFAFLLEDQRWVPNNDIFLRDPSLAPLQLVWNTGCIQCHATGGQPRPAPNREFFDSRVGELGIACESCHGAATEHVRINRNPVHRYALHLGGKPDPTIVNPVHLPAKLSSQVCGQCHAIKWIPNQREWSEQGFHYRPGDDLEKTTPLVRATGLDSQPWVKELLKTEPAYLEQRFWSDGMVRVSGREYNGLVESPCYQRGEMSCFSCHSMHESSPDDQLARSMEGNEACLQCHKTYRDQLEQHTHHQASSSGSQCYNCHMPHTTYGLLKAIRSHQIDSPNVTTTQETGRPNACNLCHLDQSLAWTAEHLSDWYRLPVPNLNDEERTISSAVALLLRGDAGQRALIAASMGWPPARRTSGEDWLAFYLGQLLEDPYSAVRYIANRSLRRLPGYQDFEFDYLGSVPQRAVAHEQALVRWHQRTATQPSEARPPILMGANLVPEQETINRLVRQRDDRSMDVHE